MDRNTHDNIKIDHPRCLKCKGELSQIWPSNDWMCPKCEEGEGMTYSLREALKKDFRKLYVPKYTTTWKFERLSREIEIGIMSLENTQALLDKAESSRQAFLKDNGIND